MNSKIRNRTNDYRSDDSKTQRSRKYRTNKHANIATSKIRKRESLENKIQ